MPAYSNMQLHAASPKFLSQSPSGLLLTPGGTHRTLGMAWGVPQSGGSRLERGVLSCSCGPGHSHTPQAGRRVPGVEASLLDSPADQVQ